MNPQLLECALCLYCHQVFEICYAYSVILPVLILFNSLPKFLIHIQAYNFRPGMDCNIN